MAEPLVSVFLALPLSWCMTMNMFTTRLWPHFTHMILLLTSLKRVLEDLLNATDHIKIFW